MFKTHWRVKPCFVSLLGDLHAGVPMTLQRRKVVVSQRMFDDETIAFLNQNRCDVVMAELPAGEADGNLSHDALCSVLQDADGWIVGHARVTRELLVQLPKLK